MVYAAVTAVKNFLHKCCSCVLCKSICAGALCDRCAQNLPAPKQPFFVRPVGGDDAEEFPLCALYEYDERLTTLLWAYKKRGMHILAHRFASLMMPLFMRLAENLSSTHAHIASKITPQNIPKKILVLSMPPHPGHKREIGFDHARIIARELARRAGYLYADVFCRKGGAAQKELSAAGRLENMRAAMTLRPQAKTLLSRAQAVILFDDVITSGATMRCAYDLVRACAPEAAVAGLALCTVE